MNPQDVIVIAFTFTIVGFTLQIFNVSYTVRLAFERATAYNTVLVLSMSLYAASFIPLFFTSLLNYSGVPADPSKINMILSLNRAHNTCYALSTLIYMILIQLRFQVIKSIWPYRSLYDILLNLVTVAFWSGTTFLFGVVTFGSISASKSLAMSALWTLYALVIDNILCFIFLYQLFKCRARVSNSLRLNALWKKSVYGLGVLCLTSWVCLALIIAASFAYSNDPQVRSLLYRVAYAFSPLQFSGALVFIYTIRALFDENSVDKSVSGMDSHIKSVQDDTYSSSSDASIDTLGNTTDVSSTTRSTLERRQSRDLEFITFK